MGWYRAFYAGSAILLAAVVYFLAGHGLFEPAELISVDARAGAVNHRRPIKPGEPAILCVAITDRCVKSAGPWPMPRRYFGCLAEYLADSGVSGIAIDLLFLESEARSREDQSELVAGLDRAAKKTAVVVGSKLDLTSEMDPMTWQETRRLALTSPILPFGVASGTVSIGATDGVNPDSVLRIAPIAFFTGPGTGEGLIPSLSLALFSAMRQREGKPDGLRPDDAYLKINGDGRLPCIWLSYTGGTPADGDTAAYVHVTQTRYLHRASEKALCDLLPYALLHRAIKLRAEGVTLEASTLEAEAEKIQIAAGSAPAPEGLKGMTVFIIATAAGLFDSYPSNIDNGKIPGGWLHVSLFRQFRGGSTCERPAKDGRPDARGPSGASVAIPLLLLALAATWAAAVPGNLTGLSVATGLWVAWVAGAFALYRYRLIIELIPGMVTIILVYLATVTIRVGFEERRARQLGKVFAKYVSPGVAKEIMAREGEISLRGDHYEASVMFLDVCGFTTFSEKHRPEEVFEKLNEYFEFIIALVFRNNGTLDKFIGDAVMAVFGVPIRSSDHAYMAVKTAWEIQRAIDEHNAALPEGVEPLTVSIGIASGPMVAGNIGSHERVDYTVIGDTVNLAARLEAKAQSGECVISAATAGQIDAKFVLDAMEPFKVKGKEMPVTAFKVRIGGCDLSRENRPCPA